MEQRKRPYAEGSETVYPKKRAALDSNGTPSHVNGESHPDEPKDSDNLEVWDLPRYRTRARILIKLLLDIPQGGHFPSYEVLLEGERKVSVENPRVGASEVQV